MTSFHILAFPENILVLTRVFDNAKFQIINNATLAGDTFLLFAGTIFALLWMRDVRADEQTTVRSWRYWLKFIFQRILRCI